MRLYKKYKEIINYLIVGVLTTVVSLLVYYLCVLVFLDPYKPVELQIANVISWICAVAFAYVTNRKFVFGSKNPNILEEISKFIGARVVTLLIDMFCMFLMVTILSINDKIAKMIVQIIVVITNYVLSKIMVFRENS